MANNKCDSYVDKQDPNSIDDLFKNTNAGLFKNHMGGAIRFHVVSNDKTAKKKYEDLIVVYGGRTVQENEISNKTAILVDGLSKDVSEKITFRLSYVLDCIRKNRLLELNPYRLGSHLSIHRRLYSDVLFWAKEDFSTFENSLKNVDEHIESVSDDEVSLTSSIVPNSDVIVNKRTRAPYTINEKEAILKFIIKQNKYVSLRGDRVWKTMECRKICPRRSYQSMKEHYWKTMRNELDRFSFLTEQQKIALYNNISLRAVKK